MHTLLRRTSHAAAHRLRLLARAEGGFTIIEVVMSAVIVVLIAGGVLTGIDAAGRSSADLRHRSQAQELAHQDQERLRGMSALQLSGLNESRDVTVDGTEFEITSTGEFLTHTGGGTSCGSETADYVKVVSTVDWQPLNKRPPVVTQSIITPPIGGTMIARIIDQSEAGVPGVRVTADGPEERFSGTTDAAGCVIFAGMAVGDYTVTASRVGFVDWDGNTSVSAQARATTSDTAIPILNPLGQAGAINASFTTRINGTICGPPNPPCIDQRPPSFSWFNLDAYDGISQNANASAANGSPRIRTHPTDLTLFPFAVGGDTTNNWTVWGGRCDKAKPQSSDITQFGLFATVNPGSTATPQVRLPALIVKVTYGGSTNYVHPDHIKLTDACGQTWEPEMRSGLPDTLLGQLSYPGQPYAPDSDRYNVCADYVPPGSTSIRKLSVSKANTDFTNGTQVAVNLTAATGDGTPC
jgi:type II secretory pathway pseudopilin PulG